jgi:hypothetical protein
VKEVEIGPTYRAARHFDDGITGFFDLQVDDRIEPNIFFAVPDERPQATCSA